MKIIFLIDNLLGGGAEKAFSLVVERLSLDKNVSVELVLLENKFDYRIFDNVKITTLVNKLSIYTLPLVVYRYYRLIATNNTAIQISTNMKSHILSILIGGIVNVVTVLSIQFDLTEHYSKRPLFLSFVLYLYKFADAYCFVSNGVYENLRKKIGKEKPYFTINNPISSDEISVKIQENVPANFLNIYKKRTIVTVGRLTNQKNHIMLLKAFSLVDMDINLLVIGVGELEDDLRRLAVDLNIEENVYFLGFQKNPYVFIRNSDCFVLSSKYEGFGNVIIEAMACGVPVISTDCNSGPREIISVSHKVATDFVINELEFADYGILTPVHDEVKFSKAIKMILEETELSQNYQESSLMRAKDFDVSKISQLYFDMFKRLSG